MFSNDDICNLAERTSWNNNSTWLDLVYSSYVLIGYTSFYKLTYNYYTVDCLHINQHVLVQKCTLLVQKCTLLVQKCTLLVQKCHILVQKCTLFVQSVLLPYVVSCYTLFMFYSHNLDILLFLLSHPL